MEKSYLDEYVWKTCSKVCSIDIKLFLSRNVHVLASVTVDFDSWGGELFWDSYGQDVLPFAQHSRAISEWPQHIFLFHHGQASRRENKPCMNQPIQVHSGLVDFQETIIKGWMVAAKTYFWSLRSSESGLSELSIMFIASLYRSQYTILR